MNDPRPASTLPLVVLESPYAGDTPRNIAYAQRALRNSISLGECPIAGHLLYTQVLNDLDPVERALGIALHCEWIALAHHLAVYEDYGVSPGMSHAIALAHKLGIPVRTRFIGKNLEFPNATHSHT